MYKHPWVNSLSSFIPPYIFFLFYTLCMLSPLLSHSMPHLQQPSVQTFFFINIHIAGQKKKMGIFTHSTRHPIYVYVYFHNVSFPWLFFNYSFIIFFFFLHFCLPDRTHPGKLDVRLSLGTHCIHHELKKKKKKRV